MHGHSMQKLSILAGLAMVASLGTPSDARADIIIAISEDGGPSNPAAIVASGSPSDPGGVKFTPATQNFGDFTIETGSVSGTQISSLSEVLSTALSITNNNFLSAGNHTLRFTIEVSNFTLPTAPPGATLISNIAGTTPSTGTGSGNAITFQSTAGPVATNTTGPQSPNITSATPVTYGDTQTLNITSGLPGSGYSVFQSFVISLNSSAGLQFTGRTDLFGVSAVPEPATMAMAAIALPLLGLGAWVRRHRARV